MWVWPGLILPARDALEDAEPVFGWVVVEPAVLFFGAGVVFAVAVALGAAVAEAVAPGTVVTDGWPAAALPALGAPVVESGLSVSAEVRDPECNAVDTTG